MVVKYKCDQANLYPLKDQVFYKLVNARGLRRCPFHNLQLGLGLNFIHFTLVLSVHTWVFVTDSFSPHAVNIHVIKCASEAKGSGWKWGRYLAGDEKWTADNQVCQSSTWKTMLFCVLAVQRRLIIMDIQYLSPRSSHSAVLRSEFFPYTLL